MPLPRPKHRPIKALPAAVLLAPIGLPTTVAAQANAVVTGRVLDFAVETPVIAAQVELLDDRHRRVSSLVADSLGRFSFERVRPGSYHLRSSSVGYREVITPPLTVQAMDSVAVYEVILWMGVEAVPLAPLEVVARARPIVRHPGLAAFHERARLRMGGRFIMREEIEETQPWRTTDLLHTAFVNVYAEQIEMPRLACAPAVYLDGLLVFKPAVPDPTGAQRKAAFEVVNMLPPVAVEGIEVFPGPATVPGVFGGTSAACGVISIWSRRW